MTTCYCHTPIIHQISMDIYFVFFVFVIHFFFDDIDLINLSNSDVLHNAVVVHTYFCFKSSTLASSDCEWKRWHYNQNDTNGHKLVFAIIVVYVHDIWHLKWLCYSRSETRAFFETHAFSKHGFWQKLPFDLLRNIFQFLWPTLAIMLC